MLFGLSRNATAFFYLTLFYRHFNSTSSLPSEQQHCFTRSTMVLHLIQKVMKVRHLRSSTVLFICFKFTSSKATSEIISFLKYISRQKLYQTIVRNACNSSFNEWIFGSYYDVSYSSWDWSQLWVKQQRKIIWNADLEVIPLHRYKLSNIWKLW